MDIIEKDKISVIPQSTEKFMSFSIGNLKFLVTAQLMPSSLETLVKLEIKIKLNSSRT